MKTSSKLEKPDQAPIEANIETPETISKRKQHLKNYYEKFKKSPEKLSKHKLQKKAWYEKTKDNPELKAKRAAYLKNYREENKDKRREYMREYRKRQATSEQKIVN